MYRASEVRERLNSIVQQTYQVDGQQEYCEYNTILYLIGSSIEGKDTLSKDEVTKICVDALNVIDKSISTIYKDLGDTPATCVEMHMLRQQLYAGLASYQKQFKSALLDYVEAIS